jgi:hypothetical protein
VPSLGLAVGLRAATGLWHVVEPELPSTGVASLGMVRLALDELAPAVAGVDAPGLADGAGVMAGLDALGLAAGLGLAFRAALDAPWLTTGPGEEPARAGVCDAQLAGSCP